MVAKKSSKANLEKSKMFFSLMGFVVVLSFLFIALEWSRSSLPIYVDNSPQTMFPDEIDMPITKEKIVQPPPPPPPPLVVEKFVMVEDSKPTEDPDFTSEIKKTDVDPVGPTIPVTENIDDGVPFVVVENMPEFIGNVFEYLSKNINYPQSAVDNQIQGKVICQFIVNKDGSIVDVEVVRSVHPSLDKEAVRVIKSMPNWKPGMQRGKPVRVKYTLPISFKLMM